MAKKKRIVYGGVALQAAKALVSVYGPREAARVSGIPFGTIAAMCFKYQWKKAAINRPANKLDASGKDVADYLVAALAKHKEESMLHLAEYTAKASRAAVEHKQPLEVARKVRDVAGVYATLWPAEEEEGLIEGKLVMGIEKPTLNVKEIEDAKMGDGVIDVRTQLQDTGSEGD